MKIQEAIDWLNSTDTKTPPLSVDGVLRLQKAIVEKQAELLKVSKEALENYSGGSHTIAAKALATIEELDKL